jgi:4'-phosphopantetheinyl transferase EntD
LTRALFRELFGEAVVVAEMDPREADPSTLLPDELALVSSAVDSRQREFAAGRLLARRLLSELGVAGSCAVLRGAEREPLWPDGIVGSITHKRGWAAVALARTSVVYAVGCDLEEDEPLGEDLWRRVLTPAEQRWLKQQANGGQLAKVCFSAKECFYKAQFSLTRQWLGFLDVELSMQPGTQPSVAGSFVVEPRCALPALDGRGALTGRYLVRDGYVATALSVSV